MSFQSWCATCVLVLVLAAAALLAVWTLDEIERLFGL